jgi:cephalosporin hydroxylase
MWRRYFGDQAKIIGVDIDGNCKSLEKDGFEIWIGDQADPAFWLEFCQKNPKVDIVLDDGGHTMNQQINTLISLFPILSDGGVYLCEDTHTSYFPGHGGGFRASQTFLEAIKEMVDEMHAWYHAPLDKITDSYIANHLYSIGIFDSIVVLEKRKKNVPLLLARGHDGHINNPPAMSHVEMRRAFGVAD